MQHDSVVSAPVGHGCVSDAGPAPGAVERPLAASRLHTTDCSVCCWRWSAAREWACERTSAKELVRVSYGLGAAVWQGSSRREKYRFLKQWYKRWGERGQFRRPSPRKDLCRAWTVFSGCFFILSPGPRALPALPGAVWPKEKRGAAWALPSLKQEATHLCHRGLEPRSLLPPACACLTWLPSTP